jgi:hypothetical protein
MILSFQTKSTPVLEKFLKSFENPTNIFIELIHNITFMEKKVTRIDNIVIIEQESFIRLFAKYAMLPSVGLIIIGMLISQFWMMNMGAVLLLLSIILLSKHFLLLTMIIKLKFSGHKEKIEMISDGFLISKLLMERRNGSTRSVRTIKE